MAGLAASARWGILLATIALLAGCGGGRSPEERVVIYVSADESVARPILQQFERETGVRVDAVFDTEATKTTGLAQRLRSERDRPRADVFWSSEIVQTILLADEGVLEPIHSETLDAWPTEHRASDNRWFAFAARARVIVYSTERVAKEDAPTTWMKLTNDRWKGRVAMADPRFGTTRTHLAVLGAVWDQRMLPGFLDAWLEGLYDNDIALLTSGNGGVVEAIAHGQFDVGMTDTDDVWAAQAQGWKVEMVYPRHVASNVESGGGTLLIPNTVAAVARASGAAGQPGAAANPSTRRLIEHLLSPAVERALMESASRNIPLGPSLREAATPLMPPDPLRLQPGVDWEKAAAVSATVAERAAQRLREPQAASPGRTLPEGAEGDVEAESDR